MAGHWKRHHHHSSVFFIVVIIIFIVCVGSVRTVHSDSSGKHRNQFKRFSSSHRSHQDPTVSQSQRHHHRNIASNGLQRLSLPHPHSSELQRGSKTDKGASHRHNRHTYGMPLVESLLHPSLHPSSSGNTFLNHYSSPFMRPLQYHRDQLRWIDRIRMQMENQIDRMRGRLTQKHHQGNFRHPQQRSSSHGPSSRYHHRVGHTPAHEKPHYAHHHQSSWNPNDIRERGRDHSNYQGKKQRQYKVFKNSFDPRHEIPEDVEVFRTPLAPVPPVKPSRPTFTPDLNHQEGAWLPRGKENPVNCTTTTQFDPFHHTKFKTTSVSHSRNNFNPVHSLDHYFTSIIGKSLSRPPLSRPSVHSTDSRFPFIKNRIDASSSSSPNESQGRSHTTSVEQHLNQRPLIHDGERDEIPCIKCPPDTRVEAPRGSDCVIAYPPSPLSCTPRMLPELRTVVSEGPAPGTVLPEGHYNMVITILTSDATISIPITTCQVNYDVEVRKCPLLQEVEGADVSCTAGRAWGSRCSWVCRGGRILHGSSVTTCTGHAHPHWSRPAPLCIDPPSERPERPPPTRPQFPVGNCPSPQETSGGSLICHVSSVEILPRRDFIPKDEPSPAGFSLDDQPSHSSIQYRSASHTLSTHPIGSVCRVECSQGRTLRESESELAVLTCTSTLTWDRNPPSCQLKVPPVLRDGDCEDVSLSSFHGSLTDSLPLPIFFTADGDLAEVVCDIQEAVPGVQRYIRKCKATDRELKTSATCQYVISTELTGPPALPKTGVIIGGGSAHNPKNTRFSTVEDVFIGRRMHKIHSNTKDTGKTPQITDTDEVSEGDDIAEKYVTDGSTSASKDQTEDLPYYFDALGESGEDYDHYYGGFDESDINIAHRQNYEDDTIDFDSARSSISNSGEIMSSNDRRHARIGDSLTHSPDTLGEDSTMEEDTSNLFYSRHDAQTSHKDRFPHYREGQILDTHSSSLEEHERPKQMHKIGQDIERKRQHAPEIRYPEVDETHKEHTKKKPSRAQSTHGHHHHRKVSLRRQKVRDPKEDFIQRSKSFEEIQEHRAKEAEESETAIMEAVIKLEVLVDDCHRSAQVKEAIIKALMKQEGCQILSCNLPETECHQNYGQEEGVMMVNWVVGGSYESIEDYYYDDLQVPVVETNIEALMSSSERLISSEEMTRTMEAHGAAIDLTSFTLTHLDLVCKHPGYSFDPQTNRCGARQ